jgi:hypothetical protein
VFVSELLRINSCLALALRIMLNQSRYISKFLIVAHPIQFLPLHTYKNLLSIWSGFVYVRSIRTGASLQYRGTRLHTLYNSLFQECNLYREQHMIPDVSPERIKSTFSWYCIWVATSISKMASSVALSRSHQKIASIFSPYMKK